MLVRLLLLLWLMPGALFAQETLHARLADEVCRCMQEITTQRPRGFARVCLLRVARENIAEVEKLLGRPLGNDHPRDMAELLGYMTAYLAADCPFLLTLKAESEVTEYRWSDRRLANADTTRLRFPKSPAPDPSTEQLAEAPQRWIITGTVVGVTRKYLMLASEKDGEVRLEIPPRLRKRFPHQIGDEQQFSYRLEWRIREGRVAKVLIE